MSPASWCPDDQGVDGDQQETLEVDVFPEACKPEPVVKAALGIWEALLRAPEITSAWWLQASLTTELKWDWSLLQQAVTLGASRWFRLPLLMSWVNLPGKLMHPVIGIKAFLVLMVPRFPTFLNTNKWR